MFVSDGMFEERYRGMNPDFVKRVWAKRREAEKQERIERAKQAAAKRRAEQKELRERLAREKADEEASRAAVQELIAKYRVIEVQAASRPARDIIREIAEIHGFGFEDIIGVRRSRELVKVRHMCVRAVADAKPEMSLPAIGRIFQRDHTSIMWALKKTRKEGDVR